MVKSKNKKMYTENISQAQLCLQDGCIKLVSVISIAVMQLFSSPFCITLCYAPVNCFNLSPSFYLISNTHERKSSLGCTFLNKYTIKTRITLICNHAVLKLFQESHCYDEFMTLNFLFSAMYLLSIKTGFHLNLKKC